MATTIDSNKKSAAELISDGSLKHIAFIMDGNGRWAKQKHMPREYGHKAGYDSFKRVLRYCCQDLGIKTVTVYFFSTENWKRPEGEVSALMKLYDFALGELRSFMVKENLQVHFLGDRSVLKPEFIDEMNSIEKDSANNKYQLNVAVNYGGRAEIVYAANKLVSEGKEINEENMQNAIYSAASPDPDLIFRTAGEMRLSNFLLWQCAYSEFYCTKTLWPDLKPEDIDAAVFDFYGRRRKYGNV